MSFLNSEIKLPTLYDVNLWCQLRERVYFLFQCGVNPQLTPSLCADVIYY